MNERFIGYVRVSTSKQGILGLGIEGQRMAIQRFLKDTNSEMIAEFAEVESGKLRERKELQKAIDLCRREKATLLIAKLDRLARNLLFLLQLKDSGVQFKALDCQFADSFTVTLMALLAEREAQITSQRTKDALKAARLRGVRLGNPNPAQAIQEAVKGNQSAADDYARKLLPVIKELRKAHVTSLRGIAHCLNVRGFKSRTGKPFQAQTVKNIMRYLPANASN